MSNVKYTCPADIPRDKIGLFVGNKGYFIKTKIILPSKKVYLKSKFNGSNVPKNEYDEAWGECKINCNILSNEADEVTVTIESPSEECNKIVISNVLKYISEFNKPKEATTTMKNNYKFKLLIGDHYIGKLIGIEGSKITELSDELKTVLKIDRRPYIKFSDNGSDNVSTLEFGDSIDEGEVWLAVSYVGDKSFIKVKACVINFINTTLSPPRGAGSGGDGSGGDGSDSDDGIVFGETPDSGW